MKKLLEVYEFSCESTDKAARILSFLLNPRSLIKIFGIQIMFFEFFEWNNQLEERES
jgi:hypothetical protein